MPGVNRFIVALRLFLLPLLFLIAPPLVAQTGDVQLEVQATKLADAIGKNLPFRPSKDLPEVFLVFDFQESNGETTQLGIHLADQLSEALRDRIEGLKLVARSKLRELIERDRIDPAAFQSNRVAHWGAKVLDANLAIAGTIEAGSDDIQLHIRAVAGDPRKRIAEENMRLSWTEDRRAWQAQSVPHFPPLSLWKDVPRAGGDGYSQAVCVSCPQPAYSEAARKAKVAGEATALALIGDGGSVHEVRLEHGLPCGLSSEVLDTVKKWKFRPVTGPDGKPAVVQLTVQVIFHLQ